MTARPVIMDVDPGVDDMAAILLALASPELDVLGVSTVAGNVPLAATLENAARVLALARRADVPLFRGCDQPLLRPQVLGRHAALGVFDEDVVPPEAVAARPDHSVAFIVSESRRAAAADRPLTLCATAPLTNLALALAFGPEVRQGIGEIVIMGGAFSALGNREPWAEFNMLADPHAAAMVFGSGIGITLFPLDVTCQVLLTDIHLERIRARCGGAGRAFASIFAASDRSDPVRFGRPGGPVHDVLPVGFLLAPELFKLQPARVGILTDGPQMGHTYADFSVDHRSCNAAVARAVDEEGLISLLIERLSFYAAERSVREEQTL